MRNPRSVWLPAALAVLLCAVGMVGVIALNVATSRSVAGVGGCPSRAFPVRPGSQLNQYSEITVGTTTGCWATYDQPHLASEDEVFRYYLDSTNTSGWTRQETYSNTHFAAFSSTRDPQIQANVGITTVRTFFVAGPATVRLDISVCRCDPQSMAQ